MVRNISITITSLLLVFASHATLADGMDIKKFSVRAGIGTDINLGLGMGIGARFFYPLGNSVLEIGPDIFFNHSTEETVEFYTYTETTDLLIFAARVNRLINYSPAKPGTYYVFGVGVAAVSVEWEEKSTGDTSLGTPLPGGGSMQSAEGTAFSTILNVGVGQVIDGGMDIRIEMPILIFLNGVGEASTFAPTIAATVGYSF